MACNPLLHDVFVPVYIYINKLKKAGALWWGSKEGLWEVTGKSLCKNVLFSENEIFKYLFILLMISFVSLLIFRWKNLGLKLLLTDATWWIPLLLLLAILCIEISSKLLDVNYPMDRVGMYLVPLFILSIGFCFQSLKILRHILFALLWFPISFVWKMNLDSSIFSPEDRIHHRFYEKMMKIIPQDATISADYVSQASYAYLTRSEKVPHVATNFLLEDTLSKGAFHISWVEELNWPGYSCILKDPVSGTRLYKKNLFDEKKLILDTLVALVKSKEAMIPILDFDLTPYQGSFIQTTIDASVNLDKYCLDLNLRHEIESQNGELKRTDNTRFDWYFGRKNPYQFHYPNHPFLVLPEDLKLHIRFYNDDLNSVKLTMIHVKIFAITKK